MASHFRSSDRQGTGEQELDTPMTPQEVETVEENVVSGVSEEEVDAIVSSLAGLSTPASSETIASIDEVLTPAPTPLAEDIPATDPGFVVLPSDPAPMPVPVITADPIQNTSGTGSLSIPNPMDAPAESDVLPSVTDPSNQSALTSGWSVMSDPGPVVSHEGTPTISLRNVSVIYPAQPNKPALDDISLDIYPGEFVFLVGHSGSGKSTFIRLLNREIKATSGSVMVAGQELTKMRNWKVPYLRRQIGCVFQDFKLLPDKTTYENVAFALECIGKPRSVIEVQVPEVLRLVGLSERMDAYPDQLSGGEQQRVSVARAMVNRPPLLICDEPTGNLDPAISLGIMKLLDRINRTGTTVVMATHDREMVDSMRRRVVALEAGHLVRDQERGGYGNYGVL
ncbi:MAG: cell division ATP-binding protein FtsE [Atopobiaceae bacterium]|nr:cell division ATP-binding protein FtsE [Atopobiaceae bacterium]